jgi:hypothetical protein
MILDKPMRHRCHTGYYREKIFRRNLIINIATEWSRIFNLLPFNGILAAIYNLLVFKMLRVRRSGSPNYGM